MPLTDFLSDLAGSSGPIPWIGWLPLVVEAQDPESWARAWAALDEDSQNLVIRRLYEDSSVYADVLRRLAVAGTEALPARDAIRETLLDDAAGSAGRNADLLRDLQRRLADLGIVLDTARVTELELGAKIAELEKRKAELLADDLDGAYSELVALQEKETRLQHEADAVSGVDLSAERARLEQLQESIDAVQEEQQTLLASVKDREAALATARHAVSDLDAERTRLEHRAEEAAAERDRARGEIDALEERVRRTKGENRVREEHRGQVRHRLDEVDSLFFYPLLPPSVPASAEAERLLRDIRALARDLPDDEADKKFRRVPPGEPGR